MTLWELACYFAVFLGGVAGGWITCAVFTAARVNELGSECAQLTQKLVQEKIGREGDVDRLIERTTECELLKAKLDEKISDEAIQAAIVQGLSTGAILLAAKKLLSKSTPAQEQESNPSA